ILANRWVRSSGIRGCIPEWVGQASLAVVAMSGNQFVHHFTAHVGEAKIPAGVAVGQPGVIETEQVQNRGVQVVDVDLLFDRPKAVCCIDLFADADPWRYGSTNK